MTTPDLKGWPESGEHRILFAVERPVWVDMLRVFPGLGSCGRQDQLALWIKAGGLRLESWMPGRQAAWIRRASLHLSTGQMRSGTTLKRQTQTCLACRGHRSQRDGRRRFEALPVRQETRRIRPRDLG